MRKLLIFLSIICLSSYCYGQDLGKNIDYQYKREGESYQAYSLYASTDRAPHTLNLLLLANSQLKELKSVEIELQKGDIKIPFKRANLQIENDDQTLQQMALNVDFAKLAKVDRDCELKIVFIFVDKTRLELPFKYCLVKEYL